MIKKFKSGFTLAEVLVTILILGVVATVTIPILFAIADDRQAKVAYKKALSVTSQGIKMLIAKEDECFTPGGFTHNSDLTACMLKVMNGNLMGDNNDEIVTPDGIIFKFVIANTDSSKLTLAEACGKEFTTTENGWKGAGNCGVIIDVNGFGKETKEFDADAVVFTTAGFTTESKVKDQMQFALCASGVRPLYFGEDADNRGYGLMYGNDSDGKPVNPVNNATCCQKCDGGLKSTMTISRGSCGSEGSTPASLGYTACDDNPCP